MAGVTAEQTAGDGGTARVSALAVPLLAVMGGIQVVDPAISSVALVKASNDLGLSASTQALAAGIATIALAATVIPLGLVADRRGRRAVLMAALLLAAAGDLVAAASPDAAVYLLGRVLAGVGLGAVFGAAYAYVRTVAGDRLAAALGTFGALSGLVALVAGFLGGALANSSWRLAYLVVPVLSLASLLAVRPLLPRVPRLRGGKVDYLGLALIAVATVGILLGVSNASNRLAAAGTWAPVLVGLAALGLFALVERRSDHAAFPIGLFARPVFVAAVVAGLGWDLAQAVATLQLSNVWQYVERYSTVAVAAGQLPLTLTVMVGALVVGRRLGAGASARSVLGLGFAAMALGFGSLLLVRPGSAYLVFLPALLLVGLGLACASVTQAKLYMAEAPAAEFGPVTSSKLTVGQFGYALGLASSSVLVSRLTFGGVTRRLLAAGVPPGETGQGLDAVVVFVRTQARPSDLAGQLALKQAAPSYVHAFGVAMLATAAFMLVVGAACVLLLRRPRRDDAAAPAGAEAPTPAPARR